MTRIEPIDQAEATGHARELMDELGLDDTSRGRRPGLTRVVAWLRRKTAGGAPAT